MATSGYFLMATDGDFLMAIHNLILRVPQTWPWAQQFADAVNRVRAIP